MLRWWIYYLLMITLGPTAKRNYEERRFVWSCDICCDGCGSWFLVHEVYSCVFATVLLKKYIGKSFMDFWHLFWVYSFLFRVIVFSLGHWILSTTCVTRMGHTIKLVKFIVPYCNHFTVLHSFGYLCLCYMPKLLIWFVEKLAACICWIQYLAFNTMTH